MLKRYWPLLLWLLYLISPIDLFPDTIFGPGFIDDLLLLGLVYWFMNRKGASPTSYQRRKWEERSRQANEQQHRSEPKSERQYRPKDPYEILNVSRNASFEEIKKAYHKQANRYHPDKVSHLGDEFQQLAKEKFQDIQWAYETLMRQRGRA